MQSKTKVRKQKVEKNSTIVENIPITGDDLKVLNLVKDHAPILIELLANRMGLYKWYDDFCKHPDNTDYSHEERLEAGILFEKLKYIMSKIVYESEMCAPYLFKRYTF